MKKNCPLKSFADWLGGSHGSWLGYLALGFFTFGILGLHIYWVLGSPERKLPNFYVLQLASNPETFGSTVLDWLPANSRTDEDLISIIELYKQTTIFFDSIYPIGIALLGALVTLRTGEAIANRGHATLLYLVASLMPMAAIFDFAENILTISILSKVQSLGDLRSLSGDQILTAHIFSMIKFTLILLGITSVVIFWARIHLNLED